jgi:RNA-directed DNA polymerase
VSRKRLRGERSSDRFKKRVREITRRAKGVSIEVTMAELIPYLRGWQGYFGFCEAPEVLVGLVGWVRLRLRAAMWRQWKTPRGRRAALLQPGEAPCTDPYAQSCGRDLWVTTASMPI